MLRKILKNLRIIIELVYLMHIALIRRIVKAVQKPIKLIRVTNKAMKRAKLI